MEPIEVRIRELVYQQYKKMLPLKVGRYSNRQILANQCQSIIYNEWGIGNNNIWRHIDEFVEEFISEEED